MITSLPLTLDVEHARFNAVKTLSTLEPSQFENERFGNLHATRDAMRTDSYYNRILGLNRDSLDGLDDALRWVKEANASDCEVRIELTQDSGCAQLVRELGFGEVEQVLWLSATGPGERLPSQGRRLSTDDWPALRRLLEHHGPISDDTWLHKRGYLCTDSFRWFGIFDGALLVSAASMWVSDSVAILGSALTRPDHRNRGHHTALLHARRSQPPHQQFVDVEPDSTSHQNCLRAGFEPAEHRTIWVSC